MSARIVSNPDIMLGKPTIEGTRITVERVLERLASGETVAEIVEAYPFLTREQVLCAIGYAASVVRNDLLFPHPTAAK